jgi:phosphoribosylformylglycinamidine synthase subunit PurQ / glutaminase
MTIKIAVIQFPGSNCEYETAKAVKSAGAQVDIIRWNTDEKIFHSYDGFVLPGGFSYQDRIRAGVISSKLPIVNFLKKASLQGKPILGICNGCQILAESGLVPDIGGTQSVEMALAPNTKDVSPVGFICDWVYIKPKNCSTSLFFSNFEENDVIPIPINHGEGRFLFSSESIMDTPCSKFIYCDSTGKELSEFPINPNGASFNIAGLTNAKGNVLAVMPHPERATFLKQIPRSIDHDWAEKKISGSTDEKGPWAPLFSSLVDSIKRGVL